MLELEPFTWKTVLQEQLDLTSLQNFISILYSYLEYDDPNTQAVR